MADPHADQPVAAAGSPLGRGTGVVVLAHGRNAAPANILELASRLDRPAWTYLAPAAAGRTWYPLSFMAPIPDNEPYLSSALAALGRVVDAAVGAGVEPSRIVLMGFSQGACLTCEFAVRHPRRYGGVVAFTGGAIGPPGTTWPARGDFAATPVFLGCSDIDAHVPLARVNETAALFAKMGAAVDTRIYPGMGHLVNDDEIGAAQAILDRAG
jgi:predicted esterase